MPQVVKAGAGTSAVMGSHAEVPGNLDEDGMCPDLAGGPPGPEDEEVVTMGLQILADCGVFGQRTAGRGMDRHQAAFAEFTAPDGKSVRPDVTGLQRQCFGNAHASRGQKAEEGVESVGADRAFWAQVESCVQNGPDLPKLQKVRGRAWALTTAKGSGWGHFMSGILGIEEGRKAPHSIIAGSGAVGRRCRGAPVMDAGDADMIVAPCRGKACKEMQGPALLGETAPQPLVKRHIAGHVIDQHVRSRPGLSDFLQHGNIDLGIDGCRVGRAMAQDRTDRFKTRSLAQEPGGKRMAEHMRA